MYAASGASLFLVARNAEHLQTLIADLQVRGATKVNYAVLDLNLCNEHARVIEEARKSLGVIDVALICHGSLPDQKACEINFALAEKEIHTNGLSTISLLTAMTPVFIDQKQGTIAVITSVAGDRGRQSNFVYGAAKAMASTYLQGLRGRLLAHNVHVVDVRPGFVDTPMTAQFKKGPLWSSPEKIAGIIVSSIAAKRHTVYAPFYWRYIMFAVRSVPEFLFKRIKI